LLFSSLLKIVVSPLKKAVISLKKKNSLSGRGLEAPGQKGLGARVEVEQGEGGDANEVLLEERAARGVEAWILGGVANHVEEKGGGGGGGARKEEARVAVERAEDDGLDRAGGVAVEEAQRDVVGVVDRRCTGRGREEDVVGGRGVGVGGVGVGHNGDDEERVRGAFLVWWFFYLFYYYY
jgi:hypothetical protein